MSLIDDLRNLDFNNVGGWPRSVKLFFVILVIAAILVGGWWFKVKGQGEEIATAERKEEQLRQEFRTKQAKAVNLDAYTDQLENMKEMLAQMLRQLPSKTEMPDLLVDISQTALASGIETELFQPGPEAVKEFYAEKPIALKMRGTYHQFGTFISGVASLPRVVILTMHDVALQPIAGSQRGAVSDGSELQLEGTVKTYRYLDEDEMADDDANTGGK